MAPKLTLIVPTFGRTTLLSTVRDIVMQMEAGDQFIISADGPVPSAKALVDDSEGVLEYVEGEVRVGDFGCTPNDRAMAFARGDAIYFLGDDDHYPMGALAAIRAAVERQPNVVHVFSMMHQGRLLRGSIESCHVSAQQIVVPNLPDLPQWKLFPPGEEHVSDWHWIRRVIDHVGRYMYHDDIICTLTKQNHGAAL